MNEVWELPGYDVESLIGFGATGEVWRARELATGEAVALKRLRADVGPTAVDALRREAELLAGLDTPYVVRLREVVGEGPDTVLVLDHAPGGSLAALLARRGALTPGEVVTVAAPLASALAAVHAAGLVHGDVSPANVLFRLEGLPLLTDLGVARLAGEGHLRVDGTAEYVDPAVVLGGEPDPRSDVWSLAAVCHHMLAGCPPYEGQSVDEVLSAAAAGSRAPLGLLAGEAPRPLVEAIEAALVADPEARPDAAGFAALLRRSHATAPVRLHGGVDASGEVPQVRPTHAVRSHVAPSSVDLRRWRPPAWLALGVVAVLVLVAAATAGWLSGREAAPVPALAAVAVAEPDADVEAESQARPDEGQVVPAVAPAAPDWPVVIRQLTAARTDAFTTGDADRLLEVYAAEAPGLAADRALLADLTAAGRTAAGLRHTVHVVEPIEVTGDGARLRVVDELSAYELRDSSGAVVAQAPARPAAAYVVQLTRTPDGWRVLSVSPGG